MLECPDFAASIYEAVRAPLINPDVTEAQAIVFVRAIWLAGNEAEKVKWQTQSDEDEAARADQIRI